MGGFKSEYYDLMYLFFLVSLRFLTVRLFLFKNCFCCCTDRGGRYYDRELLDEIGRGSVSFVLSLVSCSSRSHLKTDFPTFFFGGGYKEAFNHLESHIGILEAGCLEF